jgi:hypothetical protein
MAFLDDLLIIAKKAKIPKINSQTKRGLIFISLNELVDLWCTVHYSLAEKPERLTLLKIRRIFLGLPGCVGFAVNKRFGRHVLRCVVFVIDKAPKQILELVDG